jgi:hypothetical protein
MNPTKPAMASGARASRVIRVVMRTYGGAGVIEAWALATLLATEHGDPVFLRLERLNPCGRWSVTIRESGEAKGELFSGCHPGGPKSDTVLRTATLAELAHLKKLAREMARTTLPDHAEDEISILDDDARVIEVRIGGRLLKAVASGRQAAERVDRFRRFLALWDAVGRLVTGATMVRAHNNRMQELTRSARGEGGTRRPRS